ncbi:MAG: FmdB family zinc ribbon protein [Candidatus Manganitrophaceae bacterium]
MFVLPIYEYECEKCHQRFELLQRISDPPLSTCSSCGGTVHKQVTSPSGLVFKGSGWYITDYAKKGDKSSSDTKGEGKAPASNGKESAATKETPPPPPKPTPPTGGSSTS